MESTLRAARVLTFGDMDSVLNSGANFPIDRLLKQQAVLDVPIGAPYLIVEEQRRPDSCPLLFSWDGHAYRFVTDFVGAGGVGFLVAPGIYGGSDPTESVKVPAELVAPADDGRLVFKLVEAMEETCYLDAVDLVVVDHPADVAVYPFERFTGEPPLADGRLLAHRGEILPVAATNGAGDDVFRNVLEIDRARGWADDEFLVRAVSIRRGATHERVPACEIHAARRLSMARSSDLYRVRPCRAREFDSHWVRRGILVGHTSHGGGVCGVGSWIRAARPAQAIW